MVGAQGPENQPRWQEEDGLRVPGSGLSLDSRPAMLQFRSMGISNGVQQSGGGIGEVQVGRCGPLEVSYWGRRYVGHGAWCAGRGPVEGCRSLLSMLWRCKPRRNLQIPCSSGPGWWQRSEASNGHCRCWLWAVGSPSSMHRDSRPRPQDHGDARRGGNRGGCGAGCGIEGAHPGGVGLKAPGRVGPRMP